MTDAGHIAAFHEALQRTLGFEGGARITDDPADPGGLTKWGISKRAHPDVDIEALTYGDAAAIYRAEYWDKIRGDELPADIAVKLFDMAVNMGPGTAVAELQKALNLLAVDSTIGGLTVDGVIGPATLAAVKDERDKTALLAALRYRAAHYYVSLKNQRFARGWLKRALS